MSFIRHSLENGSSCTLEYAELSTSLEELHSLTSNYTRVTIGVKMRNRGLVVFYKIITAQRVRRKMLFSEYLSMGRNIRNKVKVTVNEMKIQQNALRGCAFKL